MSVYQTQKVNLKNNANAFVRSAEPSDATELLKLVKKVYQTSRYLITEPDEGSSLSAETQSEKIRKFMQSSGHLLLVVEHKNHLIGMLDFTANLNRRRISHRGVFGMSVDPEWQGQGVGTALLENLIRWAQFHPKIELITLAVLEGNESALALYKKFGFKITGTEPHGIKLTTGQYLADISMSLRLPKS